MTIYKPYVYIIQWTKANKGYIGVRYAKGCNPSDLFDSYHTSSKVVKHLISEVGLPDQIKIFCYSSRETALLMEEKFQRRFRVLESDYWLNRNINGKFFRENNTKHSIETRNKIGQKHKGKTISDYHKRVLSMKFTGSKHTEESKIKMRDPTIIKMIHNNGDIFTGTKFEFRSAYGLQSSQVNRLLKGELHSSKGWSVL